MKKDLMRKPSPYRSALRAPGARPSPAAVSCPEGTRLVGVDVWGNPICEPIGQDYPLAIPPTPQGAGGRARMTGMNRARLARFTNVLHRR